MKSYTRPLTVLAFAVLVGCAPSTVELVGFQSVGDCSVDERPDLSNAQLVEMTGEFMHVWGNSIEKYAMLEPRFVWNRSSQSGVFNWTVSFCGKSPHVNYVGLTVNGNEMDPKWAADFGEYGEQANITVILPDKLYRSIDSRAAVHLLFIGPGTKIDMHLDCTPWAGQSGNDFVD